jgi:hypothetical protein
MSRFICNFCNNTFTQKKNLQAHLNEKRCKSPLVTDLWKLNELLQHQRIILEQQEETIIKLSNQVEESRTNLINDEIGNIDITINPKFKDKIDLTKLTQSINKIIEKLCKTNNYKYKKYIFPSGKSVNYQGYENVALDELINMYNEDDIENNRQKIPKIQYILNNKVHFYYPDIYIKSQNLIIEVKSIFTYKKQLVKNIIKSLSVRKYGFNFEFWIYTDKCKNKIVI